MTEVADPDERVVATLRRDRCCGGRLLTLRYRGLSIWPQSMYGALPSSDRRTVQSHERRRSPPRETHRRADSSDRGQRGEMAIHFNNALLSPRIP